MTASASSSLFQSSEDDFNPESSYSSSSYDMITGTPPKRKRLETLPLRKRFKFTLRKDKPEPTVRKGKPDQTVGKGKQEPTVMKDQPEPKKKRIRMKIACDICGKMLANVWRHIREMHDSSKEKKKILRTKDGYIVYVCPIQGCLKPCARLRDHLINEHQIRDKDERNRLKKLADTLPDDCCESSRPSLRYRRAKQKKTLASTW